MRRSIQCRFSPPQPDEQHNNDFANFEAFIGAGNTKGLGLMQKNKSPETPQYTVSSKLTYGNPLQFVPSYAHAQQSASLDVARRQHHPVVANTTTTTPASPATSGSSSCVAWPTSQHETSSSAYYHNPPSMPQHQQEPTIRRMAKTSSMVSCFDDDEEYEDGTEEEEEDDIIIPLSNKNSSSRSASWKIPPTSISARQYEQQASRAVPSRRILARSNTGTKKPIVDDDNDYNYPDPDISVGMQSDEEEEEPYNHHQQYRSRSEPPPRLSQHVLQYKESLEPPMVYSTPLSKGFRGLYDKTKTVPCLMDKTDDGTIAEYEGSEDDHDHSGRLFRELASNTMTDDTASDVFDGILPTNPSDVFENLSPTTMITPRSYSLSQLHEKQVETIPHGEVFSMVKLPVGLSAIQTTPDMYRNRATSVVSDPSTNGSSTDCSVPDHQTMVSAGRRLCDNAVYGIQTNLYDRPHSMKVQDSTTSSYRQAKKNETMPNDSNDDYSDGDCWERYRVDPESTQELVRRYREISEQVSARLGFTEYELEDDERKVFALYEMRSRIMEKDIERGLERRGGTIATDDIVTTAYHRTSHRIRDALIVSKAWRDGATVSDVIRTEQLTRKHAIHCVVRRQPHNQRIVTFEPVQWLDDTDFQQYRCPSLSGRQMRGGEMFTIGDCQSILLKLTNDRCMELRKELNDATARQIDAEELMKEEGDDAHGMMSEAELTYLSTMEEVKMLSSMLVASEQAYALVRERIESLLNKYEKLLTKIETESFTGASSVITDSTYCSEYYNTAEYWEQMDRVWARRAKRAELQAELAARQALFQRTNSNAARMEKRREIEALQKKLDEVRSDSSSDRMEQRKAAAKIPSQKVEPATKNKVDTVKQRFRDRMALRQQQQQQRDSMPQPPPLMRQSSPSLQPRRKHIVSLRTPEERNLLRSAGEEMCSQMDFYERSLQAVDTVRRT